MKFVKVTTILLTVSLIILLDLIICYVVAVSLGHVYPVLPFISETGNHPPESCIFSLMSNTGSLCMMVCVWVRSQQVENHVRQLKHIGQRRMILATNKIGYLIGIFTAANLFGVANFQEMNLFTVHMITAISLFVGSALFMHMQSFISRHTRLCTPFISKLRRRQAQFQVLMVFLVHGFGVVTTLQLDGKNLRDLTPADHGHLCHALSSICEYAAVLNISIYFLTLCKESVHLSIQLPEVYLDGVGHDRPSEGDSLPSISIKSALCHMLSRVVGINC